MKEKDKIIQYLRHKLNDSSETDDSSCRQYRQSKKDVTASREDETAIPSCSRASFRSRSRGGKSEPTREEKEMTHSKQSSQTKRDWKRKQRIARCQTKVIILLEPLTNSYSIIVLIRP